MLPIKYFTVNQIQKMLYIKHLRIIIEHIEKISDPICAKTQSYVVTVVERKAIDIYRQKAKKLLSH